MRAARTALVARVLLVLAGASIVQAQTSPGADASRLRILFFSRVLEEFSWRVEAIRSGMQ